MLEKEPFFEGENLSFDDKAAFALARVQGHWNKKSKSLLADQTLGIGDLEEEEASLMEKAWLRLAGSAVTALFGDGSIANLIFGRPISLPEKDRGLIILMAGTFENQIEESSDWKRLALFSTDISAGNTFEKTFSKFKKRLGKFKGTIGNVVKRLDSKTAEDGTEISKREMEEMFDHLVKISGGSQKTIIVNKKVLEEKIFRSLGNQLSVMSQKDLFFLHHNLDRNFDDDPILTSSFASAKSLLREILQTKASDLIEVLEKTQHV